MRIARRCTCQLLAYGIRDSDFPSHDLPDLLGQSALTRSHEPADHEEDRRSGSTGIAFRQREKCGRALAGRFPLLRRNLRLIQLKATTLPRTQAR